MWSKCPTKAASFSHREKHAKTYQVGSQQHHTMVTTPIIARRSWAIEIVPSRDSPVREGKHEQTCPNHQSLRQLPNLEQKSRCFFTHVLQQIDHISTIYRSLHSQGISTGEVSKVSHNASTELGENGGEAAKSDLSCGRCRRYHGNEFIYSS